MREVIDRVSRLGPAPLRVVESPRRPGDPPLLIAQAEKIREVLGWQPHYADLDVIVHTSLAWERRLVERAGG